MICLSCGRTGIMEVKIKGVAQRLMAYGMVVTAHAAWMIAMKEAFMCDLPEDLRVRVREAEVTLHDLMHFLRRGQ